MCLLGIARLGNPRECREVHDVILVSQGPRCVSGRRQPQIRAESHPWVRLPIACGEIAHDVIRDHLSFKASFAFGARVLALADHLDGIASDDFRELSAESDRESNRSIPRILSCVRNTAPT